MLIKSALDDFKTGIFIVCILLIIGSVIGALSQNAKDDNTKNIILHIGTVTVDSIMLIWLFLGLVGAIGFFISVYRILQEHFSDGR